MSASGLVLTFSDGWCRIGKVFSILSRLLHASTLAMVTAQIEETNKQMTSVKREVY